MRRSIIAIAIIACFVLLVVPAFAGGCSGGACTIAKTTKVTKTVTTAKAPAKKVVSAVCPVMGSKIPDITKAAGKTVYKGKAYYFCCSGCKPLFDKNPEKYIHKK